jgi:hypothetical protein
MKKCASELQLEAFIREHFEAEAERDGPVNGPDAGVFSPGGGLPGLCFGDSVSIKFQSKLTFLAQPAVLFVRLTELPPPVL